jgi:soluble lytic murein transglycosylase
MLRRYIPANLRERFRGINSSSFSTVLLLTLIITLGLVSSPLLSASCNTQRYATEDQALQAMRSMTINGALPTDEKVLSYIESDHANTKAAGLARIIRARMKIHAGDYLTANQLLNFDLLQNGTAIGDYALFMRADSLEKSQRLMEAKNVYEKLVRDYPTSLLVKRAIRRSAELALQNNQINEALTLLQSLVDSNDGSALLLAAKAYEQQGNSEKALSLYRRLYFYAPHASEALSAGAAITKLNSSATPSTSEEAITRADRLFEAKRYADASTAYMEVSTRYPNLITPQVRLRYGIALSNARRSADAITAFQAIPSSAGTLHIETLYHLVQTHALSRQWNLARTKLEEMHRLYPKDSWTMKAMVDAGQRAKEAKNQPEALSFFRMAVSAFPGEYEVTPAQFELAWAAHDQRNFQESSRLLTEHLALYAGKNRDFRGRVGYWAARDSERAGKLAEAAALYSAMLNRYDANWYGYLSRQRLDALKRNGSLAQTKFAEDSMIARAINNLQDVTVAEERAGAETEIHLLRADQLTNVGLDEWALEELSKASEGSVNSPRINLAIARVYRSRNENADAVNILKRSYPDYSQMNPEEMPREVWEVFYPLSYWNIIQREAKAKSLDPYQVTGLIRQESVFNPRAHSSANAYGLMQLLLETARRTARKYSINRTVTVDSLYEPELNIQLGTAYMRDQLDSFGRIEYMAAAYNAGPGRVVRWRESLPAEMDEWAEAIPFSETRGYVQGVVRNSLQYKRLYDEKGNFRPEVGTRLIRPSTSPSPTIPAQPNNTGTRPRRTTENKQED